MIQTYHQVKFKHWAFPFSATFVLHDWTIITLFITGLVTYCILLAQIKIKFYWSKLGNSQWTNSWYILVYSWSRVFYSCSLFFSSLVSKKTYLKIIRILKQLKPETLRFCVNVPVVLSCRWKPQQVQLFSARCARKAVVAAAPLLLCSSPESSLGRSSEAHYHRSVIGSGGSSICCSRSRRACEPSDDGRAGRRP